MVGGVLAGPLDIQRARFPAYLSLLIVLISQALPALIVLDPLFLSAVINDALVAHINGPEN